MLTSSRLAAFGVVIGACCGCSSEDPKGAVVDAAVPHVDASHRADASVPHADSGQAPVTVIPQIDGAFWQVAGVPDLGMYNSPNQEPVDFAVWQAADGTWQLESCIRYTNVGGESRLLYRWEGKNLTDSDWTPVGIAMMADTSLGETAGGLQAPYVFKVGGVYHMLYGDWQHIAHATSTDGKAFTRVIQPDGVTGMFDQGPNNGTRDPMVLPIGDTFYTFFTANPGNLGTDYCRTTKDFSLWSDASTVAFGGRAGTTQSAAECPFVVYRPEAAAYFLFRTQHYTPPAQTSVYRSPSPLDFGVNDDKYFVETLPVAAPEVVEYQGQTYLAALLPTLKGIHIAKLAWVAGGP
jgi:hypothetical protein